MEKLVYRFNVDHEFVLYDPSYNPATPKARAVNEEFEYLFFYLQPGDTLETRKFYSQDYISRVKKTTKKSPNLVKEGATKNFWGTIDDIPLAQKLNNKITFYETLQKHKLDNRDFNIINDVKEYEFKEVYKPIIVKYPKSLSGKGNLKINSFEDYVLKEKKIKKWLKYSPLIVEEFIDRKIDFGVSVDDKNNFQIYQNKIGNSFQYTGSKLLNDNIQQQINNEDIEKIIFEYKSLGISGPWSIDGFIAKDGRVIFHEVNARVSMGLIFLKLKELYFADAKKFEFTIFPQRKMKYFSSLDEIEEVFNLVTDNFLLLSPLGNQFFVFCHCHDSNEELLNLLRD
jgi:hypothetical protein